MARRQYQLNVDRIQHFGDSMRGNRDHVQKIRKGPPWDSHLYKLWMSPTDEVRNPPPRVS